MQVKRSIIQWLPFIVLFLGVVVGGFAVIVYHDIDKDEQVTRDELLPAIGYAVASTLLIMAAFALWWGHHLLSIRNG